MHRFESCQGRQQSRGIRRVHRVFSAWRNPSVSCSFTEVLAALGQDLDKNRVMGSPLLVRAANTFGILHCPLTLGIAQWFVPGGGWDSTSPKTTYGSGTTPAALLVGRDGQMSLTRTWTVISTTTAPTGHLSGTGVRHKGSLRPSGSVRSVGRNPSPRDSRLPSRKNVLTFVIHHMDDTWAVAFACVGDLLPIW